MLNKKPTPKTEDFKSIVSSLQVKFAEEKSKDYEIERLYHRKFNMKEAMEKQFFK